MLSLQKITSRISNLFYRKSWFAFTIFFVVAFSLSIFHGLSPYTSQFDEHTHLSYVQYAFQWVIPANGYEMNTWAKAAFSCHPHQLYGAMTPVPCGSVDVGGLYPTGGTNTSQTWPPVYFFITAILMRFTLLFQSDPLYAARFVTAFLWSIGTAFLGIQLLKRSKRLLLTISFVLLLVSLPSFEYFSSYVTPHSMNALLIALGLYISDKLLNWKKSTSEQNSIFNSQTNFNYWIVVFCAYAVVSAFTIPQSVGVIATFIVYICIVKISVGDRGLTSKVKILLPIFIMGSISLFLMSKVVSFWAWQVGARAIAFPPGVSQADVVLDSGDAVYKDVIVQILDRWWAFWPGAIHSGIPAGPYAAGIESLWLLLLPGLSIAAIVFWKKSFVNNIVLAVFFVAPVISIYFDMALGAGIPGRYGIGIAIIGCFAITNRGISKWPTIIIFTLGVATYVSAYFLDPILIESGTCSIQEATKLLECIK